MARDPQVVAAEAAAGLRVRIETALAKAIAASRPDLSPGAPPPGTPVRQQQHQPQQPGNNITDIDRTLNPNPGTSPNPGMASPQPEPETEFVRLHRQVLLEMEQHDEQQRPATLETAQQPGALEPTHQRGALGPTIRSDAPALEPTLQPAALAPASLLAEATRHQQDQQRQLLGVMSLSGYHAWSHTHNPQQPGPVDPQQPTQEQQQQQQQRESGVAMALRQVGEKRQLALQQQQHQRQQQQQQQQHQDQHQGNKTAGNSSEFNPNQDTSPILGATPSVVSPPHGAEALHFGLPANHDVSDSDSSVASVASQRRNNTSTGSLKVDDVKINLGEETMSEGEADELLNPEVYDEEMDT
jgi:hypothetical protein